MTTIYFKDEHGQKVTVEVTDEVAAGMRECRRAEWNSNKRAERHQTMLSFDCMEDEGEDGSVNDLVKNQREPDSAFVAKDPLTELIEEDDRRENERTLKKLRAAFPLLTDEQKKLVVWKFFKNLSDMEIGKRLGNTTRQAVQNRLKKIYEKLKKSL